MPSPASSDSRDEAIRKVNLQEARAAFKLLMVTGTDFANNFIDAAEVRREYLRLLRENASVLARLASNAKTARELKGTAERAMEQRNNILELARKLARRPLGGVLFFPVTAGLSGLLTA